VTELSWRWIALMLTVPPIAGVLAAYPLWRRREMIFGNLAGTAVILGAAFALILRESIEIEQVTRQCLEAGYTCWPEPSAFARYAIYTGLGMAEVFALFAWSLKVETRIRNRAYAPEWR
jgi:hypothetical protein